MTADAAQSPVDLWSLLDERAEYHEPGLSLITSRQVFPFSEHCPIVEITFDHAEQGAQNGPLRKQIKGLKMHTNKPDEQATPSPERPNDVNEMLLLDADDIWDPFSCLYVIEKKPDYATITRLHKKAPPADLRMFGAPMMLTVYNIEDTTFPEHCPTKQLQMFDIWQGTEEGNALRPDNCFAGQYTVDEYPFPAPRNVEDQLAWRMERRKWQLAQESISKADFHAGGLGDLIDRTERHFGLYGVYLDLPDILGLRKDLFSGTGFILDESAGNPVQAQNFRAALDLFTEKDWRWKKQFVWDSCDLSADGVIAIVHDAMICKRSAYLPNPEGGAFAAGFYMFGDGGELEELLNAAGYQFDATKGEWVES